MAGADSVYAHILQLFKPVSYTHLDVYKRQVPFHKDKPLAVRGYLSPDCDVDDYEKEEVLFTSLDPYKVNMRPDVSEIAADGRSLAFITVTVDDIMGQEVQNAVNRIKFTVDVYKRQGYINWV